VNRKGAFVYIGIFALSTPLYFLMLKNSSSLLLLSLNFALGIYLVVKGSDYFVEGAASIAAHKGISEHTIGLTLVALATSLPELAVSVNASFVHHPITAWGNVVGSNVANIGLVLGAAAILMPLHLSKHVKKDAGVLLIVTGLLILFSALFPSLYWWMGLVFLIIYILYLWEIKGRKEPVEEVEIEHSWLFSWILTVFGAAGVSWGGRIIVYSAVNIAHVLNIGEIVIAVTAVAIGTSLPEFATSVAAAIKKKYGIAVGNVIGSNIFNTLVVLGASSLIMPISIPTHELWKNIMFLSAYTLLLSIFCLRKKIGKLEGFALLILYPIYIFFII